MKTIIVSGDSNQVAITLEQCILGSIGLSKVEDILAPTYLFCVHPNVNINFLLHSDWNALRSTQSCSVVKINYLKTYTKTQSHFFINHTSHTNSCLHRNNNNYKLDGPRYSRLGGTTDGSTPTAPKFHRYNEPSNGT